MSQEAVITPDAIEDEAFYSKFIPWLIQIDNEKNDSIEDAQLSSQIVEYVSPRAAHLREAQTRKEETSSKISQRGKSVFNDACYRLAAERNRNCKLSPLQSSSWWLLDQELPDNAVYGLVYDPSQTFNTSYDSSALRESFTEIDYKKLHRFFEQRKVSIHCLLFLQRHTVRRILIDSRLDEFPTKRGHLMRDIKHEKLVPRQDHTHRNK
jgi:hypothetical protein